MGIALSVFSLIAALSALVITAGLLARALSSDDGDFEVLRALGAGPRTVALSGVLGVMSAVVAGSILALVVGVALSPIGPIGPVRPVYPHAGFGFDWTALGAGLAFFVLTLGGAATFLAQRHSRRSAVGRQSFGAPVASRLANVLARAGLGLTGVTGVRFALEPGKDRDAVPIRSTLVGAIFAVTIVVATLTFGNGLSTLISHPSLYGWNWSLALTGSQDVPPQSTALLSHDPLVKSWSGVNYANVQIDGLTVPVLLVMPQAAVAPPYFRDTRSMRRIRSCWAPRRWPSCISTWATA